jgi:alpha-amylase
MKNICLYFQIHHPFSFQTFRYFDVGNSKSYYDDFRIEREINEAVTNYYLPLNDFLIRQIDQSKGKLKLSFYISGTALDQFLIYTPKILTSFRQLADTGQVEFMGGTSSHSIVSLGENKEEFQRQISLNRERIEYYFGKKPQVFVNTDLIFTNRIYEIISDSGYSALLTNGCNKILQWRSPNYFYSGENQKKIKILFRNEFISNEFATLLQNPAILENPEILKQFLAKFQAIGDEEPLINIYLNYLTLGGTAIDSKLPYFRRFISKINNSKQYRFDLPTVLMEKFGPVSEIGTEEPVCWAEHFHPSYYPGNELQTDAISQLFKLKTQTEHLDNTNLKIDWQYLQTSDHFHLMDENHPAYHDEFSNTYIYKSKYDAYINYMNILEDFRHRLAAEKARKKIKSKVLHQPIHKALFVRPNHQYHDLYE